MAGDARSRMRKSANVAGGAGGAGGSTGAAITVPANDSPAENPAAGVIDPATSGGAPCERGGRSGSEADEGTVTARYHTSANAFR